MFESEDLGMRTILCCVSVSCQRTIQPTRVAWCGGAKFYKLCSRLHVQVGNIFVLLRFSVCGHRAER